MSVHMDISNAAVTPLPVKSYDKILKTVHWTTLLLVALAYAAVWASQEAATKEQHTILLQLHRSLGVTVFAVTLFRLGWRRRAMIPGLPVDLPALQKLAARAARYFFYVALLMQPAVGVLHSNARGAPVDFYFLGELPAVIAPDRLLARQLMTVHEVLADLLLAVIALHAAAALFHHFIRCDDVLNTMLPARRR